MTPDKKHAHDSVQRQKRGLIVGGLIYCIAGITAILFVIYVGEYLL